MRRDDDWNEYRYRYGEDQLAVVEFDVGCALFTPASHGTCVRIRVADPAPIEAVLATLDDDVWLVGRLSYAGACTLVLQCESAASVRAALPDGTPAEVSEGWGFFDERVCPTEADWQRIADRQQLERLVQGGLDPLETCPVVHRFYGASDGIAALRERLEGEGMQVHRATDDRLEMTRVHPPAAVSQVSVALARFARTLGVAYDGWQLA